MQKSRPLGVTVLAYWALATSSIMYVLGITMLTPSYDVSWLYSWPRMIAWPLGAGYGVYAFIILPLSAFFAWVFVYTLVGHKAAWFANVGMSMAAFVHFAIITAIWVSNTQNIRIIELLEYGLGSELAFFGSYLLLTVLRLFYLFMPHVRDFFDTRSLLVQKRAV